MGLITNHEKSSLFRVAPRLTQILRLFVRHNFLGALRGKNYWPSPLEVRNAFEELGLTFLKLGQVLAMRRDLLPDAYINELELLQDHLPALDFASVKAKVETELGLPLGKIFTSFSETPLGSATIAQVHKATLLDGRHVAVKVQRPGLEEMIATDIAAMTYLVSLGEKLFPQLIPLDLPVLVREFAKSLKRETDFSHEARSIVLFRTSLVDVPNLWIPNVVAEHSSGGVLTMEFSNGVRVNLYAKSCPDEMPQLINTLVRLMLQTIFEEGLFHADPHPGNVYVLPDGRLSLLDFGMTGELDEQMRDSLTRLLEAVVKGNARDAKEAYLEMAPDSEGVSRAALLVDIKAVLYEIHRSDMKDVSVGNAFDALLRAGSRNGVHNPPEFFLLTRAFVILESMIRELDPEHNYMQSFREEVSRLTTKHFTVECIKEKTNKLAREIERLISDAPGDTRRVLRRIADGDLGRLQSPGIEALGRRVSRNLERLTGAITSAALVIGGAMLSLAPLQQSWHHTLGEFMITAGIIGTIFLCIGAVGRYRERRQ